MTIKHFPMQPIERDGAGTLRFRKNLAVTKLLDAASERGWDLNRLAAESIPAADLEQFMQLIGYSVANAPNQSEGAQVAAQQLADQLIDEPSVDDWSDDYADGFRHGFDEGKARGLEVAKEAIDELIESESP